MEAIHSFIGGTAALLLVALLVLAVAVAWELRPRRRSRLEEAGRPEPSTPEDWEREAALSAARSAARRAS